MEVNKKDPENYIAPIKALEDIKQDTTDKWGTSTWYQAMMTYYSFLGDYKSTLKYSDGRYGEEVKNDKIECDTAFVKQHVFKDAAKYILSRANKNKVIMLNEAHHLPYNRVLAFKLLKGLYKYGYRYFAVETLDDTLINQKQFPDLQSGYYSRESLYGELLRRALRLSFKLVAYEPKENCDNKSNDPNYCNSFRDSMMAVNLKKIVDKDPKAKIFVYAGYDHIHEGSTNSWKKMAQYFKQLTTINPLTIDQTRQVEHLYPQLQEKEFTAVNRLLNIQSPVVALKDGLPWHAKFVDITVISPVYLTDTTTRTAFYSMGGLRNRVSLTAFNLKNGQLVQAFYADERSDNRIPADQIIVNGENNYLYLFNGKYDLFVKDKNGNTLVKEMINN